LFFESYKSPTTPSGPRVVVGGARGADGGLRVSAEGSGACVRCCGDRAEDCGLDVSYSEKGRNGKEKGSERKGEKKREE
jgi:hypothetical protein